MNTFPALDPIPLPAPVWLFKALHLLLLSLHFTAVHLLLGGLAVAFAWNLMGHLRHDENYRSASDELAGYLPVAMTYVINLGVPPLLFTQVLYGPALYTSSILIGVYWISVIFLLIGTYYLLYVMSRRTASARAWWGLALLSLLIVMSVAKIYVTNMTLMLRPEVWLDMYRAHPRGTLLPPHDPTLLPRWTFMLLGGLTITGAALILLGQRRIFSPERRHFIATRGGQLAMLAAPLWGAAGFCVLRTQPANVLQAVLHHALYPAVGMAWFALVALLALAGLLAQRRTGWWLGLGAALLAILADAAAVIFRDGIRDTTLALKGFNIWTQPLEINMQILVIFAALLVAGLALTAWLVIAIARSKPVTEVPHA